MPHPDRTPPASELPAGIAPAARRRRGPRLRAYLAPGLASRFAVLLGFVLALSGSVYSTQPVAFASHTLSITPTLTPTPYGWSQTTTGSSGSMSGYQWNSTPTPTPYGYAPYGGSQSQPPYSGYPDQSYPGRSSQSGASVPSQAYPVPSNQTYPGQSNQQGATSPYIGVPDSGSVPVPGGLSGSAIVTSASPIAGGSDPCYGDEAISFSPLAPRIGNELLIAVTSAHPHPYGRLTGTEPTHFVRERPGQKGYVWEWTVDPSYPGDHEYTFYVDSTISCKKIQIQILQALATKTPKPYGSR